MAGSRRVPEGPPPEPIVQRIRIQYAKRGRMRFSSHRDFARAFERSLRRAEVPMAYSAGFHPHPKISYIGAAPTGVGSEAEYVEIALNRVREPEEIRAAIDAVLPDGLDLVTAVDVNKLPPGNFADLMQASHWRLEFADDEKSVTSAFDQLLETAEAPVERLTKDGRRVLDARAPIVSASVVDAVADVPNGSGRVIIDLVVRQVTPTVRPDDVLTALRNVAGFAPTQPPRATRLAQGPVDDAGRVLDPLRTTDLESSSRS
jgi:radical SAM-linked protein